MADDHLISIDRLSDVTFERISRLCELLMPRRRVTSAVRLSGGISNISFKIYFEPGDEPIVLRIYERAPAACRKEIDLLSTLRRTVPVPEVVHAEPEGFGDEGPFIFLKYVEGITFRQLKATGDRRAIQEASYAVGATLAAIGKHNLTHQSHASDDACMMPEVIDGYITTPKLIARTGNALADRVRRLVARHASQLQEVMKERRLVHGDFRKQNILVRPDGKTWTVAAILDWECAFTGSPMYDVAMFLRYERPERPVAEPYFSRGFLDGGGRLCDDWKDAIRVVDLESLCKSLTAANLPPDIEREIVGLVRATAV
ncbi:MAG TPA: phosphotransferase [Blastocatellia bacterium]|nr:phosphotransferase [Blastocatellia bacterium]